MGGLKDDLHFKSALKILFSRSRDYISQEAELKIQEYSPELPSSKLHFIKSSM